MAPDSTRRLRIRSQLVVTLSAVLVLMWIAIALLVKYSKDNAWTDAEQQGNNISNVVAEHFSSFAGTIDLWMQHLRMSWTNNPARFDEAVAREKGLQKNTYVNQVAVIDADGRLAYSDLANSPERVFLGDHEYFRMHEQSRADRLIISKPVLERVSGKLSIQFSRSIYGRNGAFAGVLVLSILPRELVRIYRTIDLGPGGVIALRYSDGAILVRSPDAEGTPRGPIPPERDLLPKDKDAGTFVNRSPVDDVERLFSFRRVAGYPILAVVGQPIDAVFADYYQQRRVYVAAGALLSLVLLALLLVTIAKLRHEERAEQELRGSEARFQATFDQAAAGIAHVDPGGRLILANRRLAEMLGYRQKELLGKTVWELSHPEDAHVADELRQALLAGKIEKFTSEKRYLRKDGGTVWVGLTVGLMRAADGTPQYDIAVFEDISERKRAEQLKGLEHAVAHCLADAATASAGLKAVMRAVCETEGWEFGRYFRVDDNARVLRFDEFWCAPGDAAESIVARSRAAVHGPNVGLTGTVWQSGEPLWVPDITQDPRATTAVFTPETGIRGAFVFPVKSEGETIGVLLFNSRDIREPDEGLRQAVRAIGSQIGQFLRRKQSEEELRRFRAAMDISADLVLLIDPASIRYIDVNDAACRALGYSREELLSMGPPDVFSKSRDELAQLYERMISGELSAPTVRGVYRRKDGSELPVEAFPRAVRSGEGYVIVSVARDIRARLAAEERIRNNAMQQRLIAEFGQRALASADFGDILNQGVELVSDALKVDCCAVLEFDPDRQRLTYRSVAGWPKEWIGQRAVPVKPGSHMEYFLTHREPLIIENYASETRFAPSALVAFGVQSGMLAPVLGTGGVFGVLGVHTLQSRRFTEDDVNFLQSVANILAVAGERKKTEDRLSHLAQFDALTGLPNRHLFRDRLVQVMAQAKRRGQVMAVLFIDLDRFKVINDTLGHGAGDKVLKEAAARLAHCVRAGDTVGRFGGDEFGIVLSELAKPGDASLVAQKVIDALAQPFDIDGQERFISASIGITLCPADGDDPETLVMNADAAMYRAKDQGRNNYQYFTRDMNERAMLRGQMEASLHRALERGEFMLHYQPKVDLESGRIRGFEALLRWNHPARGLVSPVEFIPVLEDTGLIVAVGEWVVGEVCRQIREWQRAGRNVPPFSINLSARQFQQKNLDATVRRILGEAGIDPALLEFEITESLVMKDVEQATRTLGALKELGVGVSMDDFGTGYSSLGYLKRFPIDTLKIDRSLIRDIATDPEDATITLAIINLAHSLHLTVVAEGVETKAQLDFLAAHGCDILQGYYFSRPVSAEECERMLCEDRRLLGGSRPVGKKRGILRAKAVGQIPRS